jgi:hypothetical protein
VKTEERAGRKPKFEVGQRVYCVTGRRFMTIRRMSQCGDDEGGLQWEYKPASDRGRWIPEREIITHAEGIEFNRALAKRSATRRERVNEQR